ncbi:hypothetical protein NUW58_g2360 [Xylaria curta]|uniref:Uncharacterized protein n=1 Tax=Xylaria curta TaxID=42375 RepID=A0ACC1PIF7_9PEZI|nr:hypothetical protein NUW58_g2360 [Xylaria curta]
MVRTILGRAFGIRMMTKEDLTKLIKGLDSTYNCVSHFEALEEKRGYDNSKQFPATLYKGGVQKILLDHWLNSEPTVYTLGADGYNFDAGLAGCEWAAFLRVRSPDAVVLRVYPKDRTAKADHILCQLLSSLLFNFATLIPDEFDKVPDLCKRNFEAFAQGGAQGIDAGLRILEALPPLELRGRSILCVVDALNLAEADGTADRAKQLAAILARILARNNGHLLYTMAKRRGASTKQL